MEMQALNFLSWKYKSLQVLKHLHDSYAEVIDQICWWRQDETNSAAFLWYFSCCSLLFIYPM